MWNLIGAKSWTSQKKKHTRKIKLIAIIEGGKIDVMIEQKNITFHRTHTMSNAIEQTSILYKCQNDARRKRIGFDLICFLAGWIASTGPAQKQVECNIAITNCESLTKGVFPLVVAVVQIRVYDKIKRWMQWLRLNVECKGLKNPLPSFFVR